MESSESTDNSPFTDDKSERARNYVQACFQQINLDAQRTGGSSRPSSSSSFSTSTRLSTFVDRGKVAAVLEAWCALNPNVHYTQGLNEVTAMLLRRHRGDQSRTMLELQRLVAPTALGGLWFKGMPLYEAGRQQLRPLLAARLPALLSRLEAAGLDQSMYLPQAWHSLFAKWLPMELAVAAVDDLLEHGMGAVLAITIIILAEVEADFLEALDEPGVEAMEVLLGPEGCFAKMRESLERCGPSLISSWQALQISSELLAAADACYSQVLAGASTSSGGGGISGSMIGLVQQEAVLRLATSASKRHDDRLLAAVQTVNVAQEKAIRDELMGNHHVLFKFAVMGDIGVGKSRLIQSSTPGSFELSWCPNNDVDFASQSLRMNGMRVKLQIWDLPGRTSFINVTRSYLHDIAVMLLVYDITCRESFESIADWLEETRKTAQNPNLIIFLVGSKLDMSQQHRQVPEEEARAFAASHGGMFFLECSAQSGHNVELLFAQATEAVFSLMRSSYGKTLPGVRLRGGGSWRAGAPGRLNDCRRALCTTM